MNTLASPRPCDLGAGFGFRGGRPNANSTAPWVQLDFGRQVNIGDSFLVPAQPEFGSRSELFPRRFLIQISDDPEFRTAETLLDHSTGTHPQPLGRPVTVHGHGEAVRYLRLTVLEGTDLGCDDAFALSELLVLSDEGEPVSLAATVTCSWADRVRGDWEPQFLTDGRTPLGLWEGGTWSPTRGLHIPADESNAGQPLEIVVDLGREFPIDRIHLLPLESTRMPGIGILPHDFELAVTGDDTERARPLLRHDGPDARHTELSPRIIHGDGRPARFVRLSCLSPWSYGDRLCHALAEIEVHSGGANVALQAKVRAWQGNRSIDEDLDTLTDGFTSQRRSLDVQTWISQLAERARIETELAHLRPQRGKLAGESELHATWVAAMALGLTFLLPVAIIERRRLMSREQVDTLRRRIASDLHDDIGSNLGSISMIARVVRREIAPVAGTEQALDDLVELESVAHESAVAMRDIVWLIERKHDTIGDLVNRLRETASRLLRDHDYKIESDCRSSASRLCLDAKRHLFLFCKEAMHNVAKHARARSFRLRIADQEGWLRIEVTDDGVGLNQADSGRKATLQKLHERARVLAGVLDITSNDGLGTTIVLRIPRSILQSRIPV